MGSAAYRPQNKVADYAPTLATSALESKEVGVERRGVTQALKFRPEYSDVFEP